MLSNSTSAACTSRVAKKTVKIALVVLGLAVLAIRVLVRRRLQPLVRQLVESRRAAKASEARFLTAAENNLDAFYILESIRDTGGEIVDFRFAYLNENGAQLISRKTTNQIVGHPVCEVFPLIRQQGFFDKYKRVAETGIPLSEEFPIAAPSMKATWISEQVVRLGDGVAVTARDVSDQKQAEEKLKYLAQNDMLTGLPNRALFFDRLQHAIIRSRRHKCSMALLFMDVDHFKRINDTLGHAAGDELLRTFAARLRICVRESDTAARLAGDEFTAILEDLNSIEDAEVVARRIVVSMQTPVALGGNMVTFTSSIGIAMYPGSDKEVSADELLEQADEALYEAKNKGRNGYALYIPKPSKV